MERSASYRPFDFETAKELGWSEIECSGDPDSQAFRQIRNPDAQRIRNNPHRPPGANPNGAQIPLASILELGAVPGFSPQLFGPYPSPERSASRSFEVVFGFERLHRQDTRGQAGALEDPLILPEDPSGDT